MRFDAFDEQKVVTMQRNVGLIARRSQQPPLDDVQIASGERELKAGAHRRQRGNRRLVEATILQNTL